MTPHPFPLPTGLEAAWTARQWHAPPNFYHYEIMGVDRDEPNYRPVTPRFTARGFPAC